jgi:tungstate transport system ATP-binding protein
MMPQEPYLLKRSVENNVAYGLKVRGVKDWRNQVKEVLNRVGLSPEHFSRRPWYELSGGEAQRVALAARLVLRPRVLLLDEPTTSLDAESAERIKTAVRAARKEWKTTLVVVSHDTKWLDTLCDQILFMAYGELEAVR